MIIEFIYCIIFSSLIIKCKYQTKKEKIIMGGFNYFKYLLRSF